MRYLPLLYLPQMLHYIYQPTYDEKQSQLHHCFKCIGQCVIFWLKLHIIPFQVALQATEASTK